MKKSFLAIVAGTMAMAVPSVASAATLVVDVTGSESIAFFGTAGNTVATYNIGANSRVTGVSYNVVINALSPSWLSEAVLSFTDSSTFEGVDLTPGIGDDFSGIASYSDAAHLADLGLDFSVGADGLLRLEYWELFNDAAISPDAIWESGTVTFTYEEIGGAVPEPSTWALLILGFGAVGGAMRNRRKQTVRVAYA